MTPTKLSMLPWFPESFIAATRGWSLIERAVYRELLDAQWIQGSLPDDHKELMRLAGATKSEWAKAWPTVSKKFVLESGEYKNTRLEEHRVRASQLHAKRSAGADKTNAQRYGERSDSARSAIRQLNAKRSLSESDSDQSASAQRSHDTDTDTDALRGRGLPRREG